MIGGLARVMDNLLGRGEAAVTVPPLDGPFRPNRRLDEAGDRTPLDGVDCLVIHGGGLVASAGTRVFTPGPDGSWSPHKNYAGPIACLASAIDDGLAVAFGDGEILIEGGRFNGRRYRADPSVRCITAVAAAGTHLYVANGSATNAQADWQRDLLERNASGSLWRIDLETGTSARIAAGLAWPSGIAVSGSSLTFSESWKHRLVTVDLTRPERSQVVLSDLPAYPGRIAQASDGYWLALFAPRSQLVEFVLREPGYRKRMMAEVPQPYWVAPSLRSGRSFHESLQGGGVKHLGMLKPWAPTMSAGFCAKLDQGFQPRSSLQSRADGRTHGITSVIEHRDRIFAAARGDGVIVACPLTMSDTDPGGAI